MNGARPSGFVVAFHVYALGSRTGTIACVVQRDVAGVVDHRPVLAAVREVGERLEAVVDGLRVREVPERADLERRVVAGVLARDSAWSLVRGTTVCVVESIVGMIGPWCGTTS